MALNALLLKTATGDRHAFRALYAATSGKLFAVLIRILGDQTEAGDVLQEVYIAVWNRADRFDPKRGGAIAWLSVITRNAGIDALRRRRPGHVGQEFCDRYVADEKSPFDRTLAGNVSSELAKRLDRLPDSQRNAVRLFYLEENSIAEISDKMEAPANTVKSWVRRGVAKLRAEFEGDSIHEFM